MKINYLIQKYQSLKQYHWTHIIGISTFTLYLTIVLLQITMILSDKSGIGDYILLYTLFTILGYVIFTIFTLIIGLILILFGIKVKDYFLLKNKIYDYFWNFNNITFLLTLFFLLYVLIYILKN